MPQSQLYEQDFYTWSIQQAELLRQKKYTQVDWDNLIEEVEDLGRSEYRALVSAVEQLTLHLLKWQFQPNKRSRSWQVSIAKQRIQIEKLLEDNPGLTAKLEEVLEKGYKYGRRGAIGETQLSDNIFPIQCPYAWSNLTNNLFFPD